jgi:uncharacterized protein (TIRG00374 family)
MNRSVAYKILRLAVSAGLIVYLIAKLDFAQVMDHVKGLDAIVLGLAAAMIFGMILLNSVRWAIVLRARGVTLSLVRLLYYYLMGIFFSSFLPTSVGGDFARMVAVSNKTGRKADAFASVVVERLLGFFVLLPVGLVSIPFVSDQLTEWRLVATVGVLTALVFLAAYLVLLRPVARRLSRLLDPLLNLLSRFRARQRLEKAYEAIVGYRGHRGALYAALALSVASRLSWIAGCYLVGRAFSLNLTFTALMLVVPVVELVRMIPISISGLGVREAAFVTMLRQFGIQDGLGFAFAVVVYLIFFLFALLGGILYGTRQFSSASRGSQD